MDEDDELNLVGLVRIAKREPKFTFLGRSGERTNPLFRGFGNQTRRSGRAIRRAGADSPGHGGQGRAARRFSAGCRRPVSLSRDHSRRHRGRRSSSRTSFRCCSSSSVARGGGLSCSAARNRSAKAAISARRSAKCCRCISIATRRRRHAGDSYRLRLTREGWLQPWVRLRSNEQDETKRLADDARFQDGRIGSMRSSPGRRCWPKWRSRAAKSQPALVVQPFGRGRVGAVLISDLWRWNLQRKDHKESDLDKAWRQTVRWLVSDVPQPVEVETRRRPARRCPAWRLWCGPATSSSSRSITPRCKLKVKTPDKQRD